MNRFTEWNHLQALAAAAAGRAGYSMRELRAKGHPRSLTKARRSVIRELRDAGASWERCGKIMRRHPESLREMALRYERKVTVAAAPPLSVPDRDFGTPADHGFLCECDGCLNGENPLLVKRAV